MSEAGFCRNSPNLNHEGGITAPGRFREPSHTSSNSCTKLALTAAARHGLSKPAALNTAIALSGAPAQGNQLAGRSTLMKDAIAGLKLAGILSGLDLRRTSMARSAGLTVRTQMKNNE